jgi:tetratricopeptide (TPR) repeat protein
MINIVLAFCCGIFTWGVLFATHLLDFGEAVVPGVIVLFVAYFLLARRTFKQVEKIALEAAKHLQNMPPKFDLAIQQLQKAYPLARLQIGVKSQIDGQIGMIYFLNRDFSKAAPYLQSAQLFGHWSGTAMLAVTQFKKKDYVEMKKTLELVVKRAKSQGLAWNLYAYLLEELGEKTQAMAVLVRGIKATKNDPKVAEALLCAQNNKRFKMRAYKEQWYQFHLERPPVEQHPSQMLGRQGRVARRGRW